MATCANCGRDNEGNFAFCPHCGAELAAVTAWPVQRKTVTVLFCDVTGSTALGESTDPEALRALLARYFERMKEIIESHGGTLEKFIGDAVMAVFGVPAIHEDDALRAVRAACEMRDALPKLGVEARIGVNTGEVVTGTEERLVTGDAVNVAARLEQAAQPGEVLIGEPTLALVREAVEVEPLEPLALKGKSEPVAAYRLRSVHEPAERRSTAPMVGRERELREMHDVYEQAVHERSCRLLTVLGTAGVGKSRLVAEFVDGLDAVVVRGRCLSYGAGITYWPVVEVIKQLDSLPSDPAAAASIRSVLGEGNQGTSAEEIAWAFRKLLEERAPLVCVFDDIQWGEDTFLDLLEHVALLSTGAPILLLCMARPELVDRRPQWPVSLRLEPLPSQAVDELIPETFSDDLRAKITRAAGGNPLFITEMVAIAQEADAQVAVPPTLTALLSARLDQLDTPERSVLERGAVEGEIFHRGAVQALAPQEIQITPRLASLVRKELIRPDRPQLPAEDAFRFRHLLIRDAAYNALPKATRAELHERYADWLEQHGADLVELDEILGYHLEEAARYKAELGQPEPTLAERAGDRLAAAGRRALWRDDRPAAVALLERALELTRPLRLDLHLELVLGEALTWKDARQSIAVAEAVVERADAAGDITGGALARVVAANLDSDQDTDKLEALARKALPLLEEAGDHAGLVHVWTALGFGVANGRGRFEDWAQAAERAIHHARLAGQQRTGLFALGWALINGPRPADEALQVLDAALPEVPSPNLLMSRAWLTAMLGRFDDATSIAYQATERARALSGLDAAGFGALGEIAALAGDYEAAAQNTRRACDLQEERGQTGFLSTSAPRLGRFLCMLGRHDEAASLAQLGRELGTEDDVATQMIWRQAQALVHAFRGEHAEAEALGREAVSIAERTDGLDGQGETLFDLAEVLASAGRVDEAAAALEQALERYERKKNLAMVAQLRPRLDALRAGVTSS